MMNVSLVIGVCLAAFLSACASQTTSMHKTDAKEPSECVVQGGEFIVRDDPLFVYCVLPPAIRTLGTSTPHLSPRRILTSVYGYLYGAGTERPDGGLYSYALFPVRSPRAERFLEELFKTTGYVDNIGEFNLANLNLVYLPVRADKLPSLKSLLRNGSAPLGDPFATQFYDYALAQRLLTQICAEPAEVIRDACLSDLSRGPYLFTYRHPMSTLSPVSPPYLFLDLSTVHERAFGEFIRAYKEQVKRTDYTDLARIDNLRLRLLSIVLTAADWIDPVKGALTDILHLAKGEDGPRKPDK